MQREKNEGMKNIGKPKSKAMSNDLFFNQRFSQLPVMKSLIDLEIENKFAFRNR